MGRLAVSHRNEHYARTAALILDLLDSRNGSVGDVAKLLGVTTSSIVKFLEVEPHLWGAANAIRKATGSRRWNGGGDELARQMIAEPQGEMQCDLPEAYRGIADRGVRSPTIDLLSTAKGAVGRTKGAFHSDRVRKSVQRRRQDRVECRHLQIEGVSESPAKDHGVTRNIHPAPGAGLCSRDKCKKITGRQRRKQREPIASKKQVNLNQIKPLMEQSGPLLLLGDSNSTHVTTRSSGNWRI